VIDFTFDEIMELARAGEMQRRAIAERRKTSESFPDFCVIETLCPVQDDQGFEIPAGAQGAVLDPLGNEAFYVVEFSDPAYQNRDRIGLATLPPDVMRVVWLPGDPVTSPDDLRGKLGETAEGES
jgi:hypothetical protein